MKQVDTLQKSEKLNLVKNRCRLWMFMLVAVLSGTAGSYGQDIDWQTVSVSGDLYRNNLDEGKQLEFYFKAYQNVVDAEIQITLPTGVKVTAATPVVTAESDCNLTFGTASVSSGVVTIPVSSGLAYGNIGHAKLDILADCDATVGSSSSITVQVVDKAVSPALTDAGQSTTVTIVNPSLTVGYTMPDYATSDFENGASHTLILTSTGGKTNGVTIKLTVDDTFTLSGFEFEGSGLSTVTQSGKIYTITLTDKEIDASGKTLTFNSIHPGLGSSRSITYTITTGCNVSLTGKLNFLVRVDDAAAAAMEVKSVEYVGGDFSTLCYGTGVYPTMDGSMVYIKATYQNTGAGAAAYFQARSNGYGGGLFYHKKDEKIYYQIEGKSLESVDTDKTAYATLWTMAQAPVGTTSDWYRTVTVNIYDVIPAGKEIVVYFPCHFGLIYETGSTYDESNLIAGSRDYHLGSRIFALAVQNKLGTVGAAGGQMTDFKPSPRFYDEAPSLTFTDETPANTGMTIRKEVEMTINTGQVGSGSDYSTFLQIDVPSWLSITDMSISQPSYGSTSTTFSITPTVNAGEYEITRSASAASGKILLTCAFEVNQATKPVANADDFITYSLEQKLTVSSSVVSSLETGRMFQPVYYRRTFNGIQLQSFVLKRDASSQGYAPTDTSDPEAAIANGTTAPDQDKIDHTIYLADDLGAFEWKVKLIDAVSSGESIFLSLTTNDFALGVTSNGLQFDTPTVSINSGIASSTGVEYKKANDLQGYIQYTPGTLAAGSELIIRLPFTVKGYKDATRPVITKALIGGSSADPITGTGALIGSDTESLSIGTYQLEAVPGYITANTHIFANSTSVVASAIGFYTFWTNYLMAPHFPYEVRQLAYLSKVEVKVPKGYTLKTLILRKYDRTLAKSYSSSDFKDLLSGLTVDTSSDADYDIYRPDVASLFGPTGWGYPDDKWEQRLDYSLEASTRVKSSSTMNIAMAYTNPITDNVIWSSSSNKTLAYTGNVITVESLSPLTPDNKDDVSMSVNFSNGGSATINDNWLLVEGSFSDLTAEAAGLPVTVLEGKYVPVASTVASGKTQTVMLNFKFTGASGDAIKLTPLSGWQGSVGSFTPSSSTLSDDDMGISSSVIITPLANQLDASLKVSKVMFEENDLYELTATLSSASSPGSIQNPTMEITVPAGQTVQSAVVTYGGVSYPLTDTEFATKFPVSSGKFTFDVRNVITPTVTDITFPGYASVPTVNETTATLVVTYQAGSGSLTTGMSFTGVAAAEGLNNGALAANVESQKMFPKLALANEFAVTLTSDGNAFSSSTVNRTLTVAIEATKIAAIPASDYIELELPTYLSLTGTPSCTGGTTSITSNDISSGARIVKLVLPTSAFTGVGSTVTYTIPVVYDGTGADQTSPKKELVAKYITETLMFGSTVEVAAATGSLDVLFIKSDALEVFADQSPGGTLNITSTNVTGEFWTGSTWSSATSSTTISPVHGTDNDISAATGLLATQRVRVIYETVSYGEVELPYTVYPSLVYTLTNNSFTDCGTVNIADLSALVGTKTATNTTVKFYSDSGCTSEITGSRSFTSSTTIYARSGNQGGNENPAKAIAITVNNELGVTISASSTTISAGSPLTLTATLTGTAPSGAKYNWYKGASLVSTTSTATYTIASATIADAGSYYVTVANNDGSTTGLCANESGTLTITVNPADVVLSTSSATLKDCTLPVTAAMDNYITVSNTAAYVSGETFWWNTSNTTTGAYELGGNHTAQFSSGTYTAYVWAKSGDNYSAIPAQLTLVVSQYVAVSLGTVATTPTDGVLEATAGTNAAGTITITGTGGDKNASNLYEYRLYDSATSTTSIDDNTTGSFSLTLAAPTSTDAVAYKEYTYYVTAQGMCDESAKSSAQTFKVYPSPALALSGLPMAYCETYIPTGVDLWDYIDNPNSTQFTYKYHNGSDWYALAAGDVVIPATPGTYTYDLKAINARGTESSVQNVSVTVYKKTSISSVSGQEVTEGQAINIVVVATGEGTLQYTFEESASGGWTTLASGTANTYQITPSASISADNGKQYRVTVTGAGSCAQATSTFSLKVNSATTPPLGNNKVTWEVVGYGNASVTADGISISNGSHVNNGTTLVITGTTWKSNVLQSITVNGTEYSSSPVSYTVNGTDVHIIVEFLGSDPNPDPSSNAKIENGNRIWTEGGYACIYTETANRVRIVTFNGRMVTDQKLSEGESRIQLSDGYYIVTLSDGTTAKVAVRNF